TTTAFRKSNMALTAGTIGEVDGFVRGAKLSQREREVLRCFLNGMTVGEIAKKFDRSAKTISTQKFTAYRKLGVSSDNELFKIARLLGDL
ncbi:MAG: response regulator transcription factor, partial [Comamonadaceae bacterium]